MFWAYSIGVLLIKFFHQKVIFITLIHRQFENLIKVVMAVNAGITGIKPCVTRYSELRYTKQLQKLIAIGFPSHIAENGTYVLLGCEFL